MSSPRNPSDKVLREVQATMTSVTTKIAKSITELLELSEKAQKEISKEIYAKLGKNLSTLQEQNITLKQQATVIKDHLNTPDTPKNDTTPRQKR